MEVIEVTEREIEIIEVIERGPQGPTGPTGPQGPAGAGGVTSVSGTAPIVSSGGTTPVISVTTGSTAGTVAAGDHTHTNFSSLRIDPANGSMGSLVVGNTTSGQNNYVTIDGKIRLLSPSNSFVASLDATALSADRAISLPNASGTIALTGHTHAASDVTSGTFDNARINFAAPDSIGSTTRNTGAFTTLNANNGTITSSAPVLDLSQTWNNAAVTFTGLRFNVTNTASASTSNTLELQNNGTAVFFVRRTGGVIADSITCTSGGAFRFLANASTMFLQRDYAISWTNDPTAATNSVTNDLILRRDAAGVLGQRDLANPQAYRIYNTTDAGLTNYERGFMRWSSNTLQIGTEAAGTGSARALDLIVGGNRVLGASTGGTVSFGQSTGQSTTLVGWVGNCFMRPINAAAGVLTLLNAALDGFDRLQFGGTTSSFPALKRSSTTLQVRLADDSAFAPLECGALTLNGNLTASTRNIVTDAVTGTRIGTATTQLLGFWNAAPSAQPAAVADATDAASTQARLNDLLARLRTIGLIAT